MDYQLDKDGEITNKARANYLKHILVNYYDVGLNDYHTPAVDLLADMMHICYQDGIDFNQVLEEARIHFDGENDG